VYGLRLFACEVEEGYFAKVRGVHDFEAEKGVFDEEITDFLLI
jgi:hypothetical protein